MKQSLILVLTSLSLFVLNACSKSSDESSVDTKAANEKRASEFQALINGHTYRLVDFYSDKPIDYIGSDDVVKKETDLKVYIKPYLLDDQVVFDGAGGVRIAQNQQKIPGLNDPVLNRNYNVTADINSAYLDYLDYNYNPTNYKLSDYSTTAFLIYLDWPGGAKVFSKFERIN